jgi:aspartate racemase
MPRRWRVKIIGLVGGTGWISTAEYYRYINEETNRRLGGLNFAECVIYSLDFGRVQGFVRTGRDDGVYPLLLDAAKKLERAGAEGFALCTNTMHKFADALERELSIPLVHIATATGNEINARGLRTVGLLGTKLTMELDFYKDKLAALGIETLVPAQEDRDFIERAIFDELLKGIFAKETKARFLRIMDDLRTKGARGIVLGCTEIPLLVHDGDTEMPLFNTTLIHARAIVDFALGGV